PSAPTWPASACSEGSSTRSWSMSYRCSWATGSAFRPRPSTGLTSNHSATPSRAPSPCSASACLAPKACSNLGRPEASVIVEAHRSLAAQVRPSHREGIEVEDLHLGIEQVEDGRALPLESLEPFSERGQVLVRHRWLSIARKSAASHAKEQARQSALALLLRATTSSPSQWPFDMLSP